MVNLRKNYFLITMILLGTIFTFIVIFSKNKPRAEIKFDNKFTKTGPNNSIQEIKDFSYQLERRLIGKTYTTKNEILRDLMLIISASRKAYTLENTQLYPQIAWACVYYNQLWKLVFNHPYSPDLVRNLQEHLQNFREKI